MTDSPMLVQEESTRDFGLYYPDENVIETYIGDDKQEIPGDYVDHNWHEVDQQDLAGSIEADLRDVREDIEALRERDLSDEQARELDRLESRVESHENVLEVAREVQEDA